MKKSELRQIIKEEYEKTQKKMCKKGDRIRFEGVGIIKKVISDETGWERYLVDFANKEVVIYHNNIIGK